MISDGSELLLLIPSVAGLVGSVVLPVLGAVPDGAIVLFSGIGPDAQEQLTIGIGALAGSTIMLLTGKEYLRDDDLGANEIEETKENIKGSVVGDTAKPEEPYQEAWAHLQTKDKHNSMENILVIGKLVLKLQSEKVLFQKGK